MASRRALVLVLVAALLVRLASNHLLTSTAPVVEFDALWYHASATTLAKGQGYLSWASGKPSAAWPPGYPAILSVAYRVLGADPSSGYLLNALAGTVSCWLTGLLAFALHPSRRLQLLATALMALAPGQVLFASLLLSETVFTMLLLALLLAAVRLLQRGEGDEAPAHRSGLAGWALWGAGVGLVSLVRAEAVVLLGVPVLALAATRASWRRIAATALVCVVALVAAQSPWLLRNARLFGQLVPVSSSFGRTLLIGHNPEADGGMNLWSPDPAADRADLASGDPARELAVDRRSREAAIAWARSHPREELRLVAARFVQMFRGDRVWGEWYHAGPGSPVGSAVVETLGRVSNLFYWSLLLVAAPALWRSVRSRDAARLVIPLTMLLWTLFFVLLLYGTQRFHFPLVPLFAVAAADTLRRLAGRSRGAV